MCGKVRLHETQSIAAHQVRDRKVVLDERETVGGFVEPGSEVLSKSAADLRQVKAHFATELRCDPLRDIHLQESRAASGEPRKRSRR